MNYLKKCFVVLLVIGVVSLGSMVSFKAIGQGGGQEIVILNHIEASIESLLKKVDTLVALLGDMQPYVKKIYEFWNKADSSKATAEIQGDFTQIGNKLAGGEQNEDLLVKFNNDLFGGEAPKPALLPEANDMVYSSLLGRPIFKNDPRSQVEPKLNIAYNYIKNASGLSLPHLIPLNTWQGSLDAQAKYKNYYQTLAAVESFDSYALSSLYEEATTKEGKAMAALQKKLILEASRPEWFKLIASEEIGVVLRQLLMYQSQLYIVAAKLLSMQTKLLSAQVMGNTLLIASNQNNEQYLVQQATGAPIPSS